MFEKAVRMKLRWPFRGLVNTEDLWDLSVEALDDIFKNLNQRVKAQEGESLLETKTEENEALDLQIAIVRHIVSVKLAEANERKAAVEKAAHKQKILGVIAQKQNEQLLDLSVEELEEMVEGL
jgi:hypothetical protein